MAEKEMDNPQEYRGGVAEPPDAKGGAPHGHVPREMVDEDGTGKSDPQEMSGDALGGFPDEPPTEQVPRDAGDDADATNIGGYDPETPSWAGDRANPDAGRVGEVEEK
jgi:hypothetical protein